MQDGDATGELGELQEYVEALLTDFKSAPERSIPEHLANEPFDSTASSDSALMGSAAQGPGLANGILTLIGTVQELSRMKSEILMSSRILPWRPPALVLRLMTWVPSSRFFVLNMIQRLVEKVCPR